MMNNWIRMILIAAFTCGAGPLGSAAEPARTPDEVLAVMKKTADWQIEHLRDDYDRRDRRNNRYWAWTYATLYVGIEKLASVADDESY